jgi:DNA-binding response OmpR family regulator
VERIVFLTDRSPFEALPALQDVGFDVKSEPLDPASLPHLVELSPWVLIADAEENPDQAFRLLNAMASERTSAPVVVVVARTDLERLPWHEVADELAFSGTTAAELRVRLAMLTRRTGGAGEAVVKLGPIAINTETYQVLAGRRVLDLTYREFELLKFLVQRPGRVFSRGMLLREVWGYDFYGGTRTVDVHVRRLRAKLGPEHEALIETVRGVGYRAADPNERDG